MSLWVNVILSENFISETLYLRNRTFEVTREILIKIQKNGQNLL